MPPLGCFSEVPRIIFDLLEGEQTRSPKKPLYIGIVRIFLPTSSFPRHDIYRLAPCLAPPKFKALPLNSNCRLSPLWYVVFCLILCVSPSLDHKVLFTLFLRPNFKTTFATFHSMPPLPSRLCEVFLFMCTTLTYTLIFHPLTCPPPSLTPPPVTPHYHP